MVNYYNVYPSKKKNLFSSSLSVNTILIGFTILFYFIFRISGFSLTVPCEQSLCKLIALQPSNILSGKYIWTFLTSIFMHGGFFHLFANMLSLFFIGSLVEKLLGHKRYLLFYLISGLFAGVFFALSSMFFGGLDTYAVGASGALFGLVGLLILLTPNLPVYVMFIPIPIKMKYAGPGILLLLWAISIAGNVPIGNTAHLGGLIAGLGYGIYLRKKYKNKTKYISRHFS